MTLTVTQRMITEECDRIKALLLEKNRKYGNSAIEPVRIFSKASPIEQINVRLDDKLSRKISGQADEDEDIDFDIIGYLILKRVALRFMREEAEGIAVTDDDPKYIGLDMSDLQNNE